MILLAIICALVLVYTFAQKPLYRHFNRKLAEAQREHARWIAICLELTKNGCSAEAKFAAEQVVVLRGEISFYRGAQARLRRMNGWGAV